MKPRISHFTPDEIVFVDGSTIVSKQVTILLCTGYALLAPFLRDLHEGPINSTPTSLTTNGLYIRPLHHAIFGVDTRLPRDAIAFISIPFFIANGPNAFIQVLESYCTVIFYDTYEGIEQGLFLGHSFANPDFLPPVETALKELHDREEVSRAAGFEPFDNGK